MNGPSLTLSTGDGEPPLVVPLSPEAAPLIAAWIAARHAREQQLLNALTGAIEQLEGWVSWKCPKKYRAEHEAYIAELRSAIGAQS